MITGSEDIEAAGGDVGRRVAIGLGRSPPSRVHLDEGWYNPRAVIATWDTLTC